MLCAFPDDPNSPGLTIDALGGLLAPGCLRVVLRSDPKDEFGNRGVPGCAALPGVCCDGHRESASETKLEEPEQSPLAGGRHSPLRGGLAPFLRTRGNGCGDTSPWVSSHPSLREALGRNPDLLGAGLLAPW